jgi:hypothetical protein
VAETNLWQAGGFPGTQGTPPAYGPAEPEKKRSAKRESYQADPVKKQTAELERYQADPE